jgi:hypothetical protein
MPVKSQMLGNRSGLQTSARVVYEKNSGKIVHIHKTVWRPEMEPPAPSEIDAHARRVASKVLGETEDRLEVLAVELDQLETDAIYAVDIQTRKVIKTDRAE